jgi:hypothetical protein
MDDRTGATIGPRFIWRIGKCPRICTKR